MHCHKAKNRLFFWLLTGGGSHWTATLQTNDNLLENDASSFNIYSSKMTNTHSCGSNVNPSDIIGKHWQKTFYCIIITDTLSVIYWWNVHMEHRTTLYKKKRLNEWDQFRLRRWGTLGLGCFKGCIPKVYLCWAIQYPINISRNQISIWISSPQEMHLKWPIGQLLLNKIKYFTAALFR